MPLNRSARNSAPAASPAARRLRPANPSCRGGASSLLRLTQPASQQRLPTAFALSDWASHAASVLMPVTGPHFEFGARAVVAGR